MNQEQLAKIVVSYIVKDGAAQAFMSANIEDRIEMASAYVEDWAKKSAKFTEAFFTKASVRKQVEEMVYSLV